MATGGQLIAQTLEAFGVKCIWGMSGHTNIAALDALIDTTLQYVSVRHEQVAAHAADCYFRVTHRPGVVLVHNGPGLSNAITGIGDAANDCSAMLVIAGDVALRHEGRDAFQEVGLHADASQLELARPLVKRAWRVHDVDKIPDVLARAWSEAISGRPGPVLVSVPMDLLSRSSDVDVRSAGHRRPTGHRVRGDRREIARAAELLLAAERPVIHAGGGVALSEAEAALVAVAEHLGAPVTTTMAGKGTINEDHPLSAGTTGRAGTPVANDIAQSADVLLAVGTQFPEQDSSSWSDRTFRIPPARLIHVDIDPRQIGKIYPSEIGILGDARAVLEDLLRALRSLASPRDWRGHPESRLEAMARQRVAWLARLRELQESDSRPVRPERVLHEMRSVLPPEGIVVGDVGWGKNGVSQQYISRRPRTTLVASGYGTMGFAAAGALGVKMGRPDAPVLSLTGDGGMSSVLSAVVTGVEYGIGVVWVVFNNGSYAAIDGLQKTFFGRSIGGEFVRVDTGAPYVLDFAAVARALGAEGTRVEDPAQIRSALEGALASRRPYVVDIPIDRTATYQDTGYWDVAEVYRGR